MFRSRTLFALSVAIVGLVLNAGRLPAADLDRTQYVGRGADGNRTAYEAVSADGQPLVGFELGLANRPMGYQVSAFRPIFKGEKQPQKDAGLFRDGPAAKALVTKVVRVVAKDGYAVSGITVQTGLLIEAVRLRFAKLTGDALDLNDWYQGDWLGAAETKGTMTQLESDGRPILGVTAAADDVKAWGIGFVYAAKPGVPAPAPRVVPTSRQDPRAAQPPTTIVNLKEHLRAETDRQFAEFQKAVEKFNKPDDLLAVSDADVAKLRAMGDDLDKRDNLTVDERAKVAKQRQMLAAVPSKAAMKATGEKAANKSFLRSVALGMVAFFGVSLAAYFVVQKKRLGTAGLSARVRRAMPVREPEPVEDEEPILLESSAGR
jgi:hypothetical protein